MRRAARFLLPALALALFAGAGPAVADPTEAQLGAIKSNCRSDFMSNCWGVPRGGKEAFQCLKEHMASLSPGCAQAVKAVSPPAPPPAPKKTETASPPAAEPAPAPAAAEAEPAAPAATETPAPAAEAKAAAPEAAPESASAPKPAAEAPKAEAKAPPPPPQMSEPAPAELKAEPKTAEPKAAAVEPEAAQPIIGFIPPRKKLMVQRNCRQDLQTYCADVDLGDGRILRCLLENKASLTADCQGALARLSQ